MCDKVILESGRTLMFVPDCYKITKMRNKINDNYAHVLEFVPDCYQTYKLLIFKWCCDMKDKASK